MHKKNFTLNWRKAVILSAGMMPQIMSVQNILFPIFVIIIGWRLIAYYLSDDFQKGYYMGKISFVRF